MLHDHKSVVRHAFAYEVESLTLSSLQNKCFCRKYVKQPSGRPSSSHVFWVSHLAMANSARPSLARQNGSKIFLCLGSGGKSLQDVLR